MQQIIITPRQICGLLLTGWMLFDILQFLQIVVIHSILYLGIGHSPCYPGSLHSCRRKQCRYWSQYPLIPPHSAWQPHSPCSAHHRSTYRYVLSGWIGSTVWYTTVLSTTGYTICGKMGDEGNRENRKWPRQQWSSQQDIGGLWGTVMRRTIFSLTCWNRLWRQQGR